MKKILIALFAFMLIGSTIAGGVVLYDNISVSAPDSNVSKSAPTNDDLWTDRGNYATSFAGGDWQSEATAYQIATAEQLARLAYLINSSSNSTYNDLYYVQTANIDLSLHYWDSIGNYGSSPLFLWRTWWWIKSDR